MVTCNKCDAAIDVDEDELDPGDVIECEECGAALRVLSTDPLELESDAAADDDEDEDVDDDDDDEDDEDDDFEEDGDDDFEEDEKDEDAEKDW